MDKATKCKRAALEAMETCSKDNGGVCNVAIARAANKCSSREIFDYTFFMEYGLAE